MSRLPETVLRRLIGDEAIGELKLDNQGFRLVDFDASEEGGTTWYHGVWRN